MTYYKVLHIPSGHFLQVTNMLNSVVDAEFTSKAKAGHAIQWYRLGPSIKNRNIIKYSIRFYVLNTDYDKYFNPEMIVLKYKFRITNAQCILSLEDKKKSPIEREKILKSKGIIIPSKEEFLIMEII